MDSFRIIKKFLSEIVKRDLFLAQSSLKSQDTEIRRTSNGV